MLDISPYLVLISGATFLTMLFVLNTILYKPMISFMNDRDNSLSSNEGAIKACQEAIIANNNTHDEIIKNAGIKAEKLIHSKQQDALSKSEVKIQASKDDLESQYEVFLKELESAKSQLKTSISANTDKLSQAINNKLVSL